MTFGNRLNFNVHLPQLDFNSFRSSPEILSELGTPSADLLNAHPRIESLSRLVKRDEKIEAPRAIKPEKVRGRAELFTKYADETYLPGENGRTALCVAGFGASSYPVSSLAHFMNSTVKASVLYSPLAMHSTYEQFRQTKYEAWVDRVDEQSARLGNPYGILYSAASLAAIKVERQNPGRFRGFIFIGTPLKLCSQWSQFKMSSVYKIRTAAEKMLPPLADYIDQQTFAIPCSYKDASKSVRKNVTFKEASGAALLELYKGQQSALRDLPHIKTKILYFQGEDDELVSRKVPGMLEQIFSKDQLAVHMLKGGHGPQLEESRSKMQREIANWIKQDPSH